MKSDIDISLVPYEQFVSGTDFDLDRIIYDLDNQIELLSSQADNLDYLVSAASGILCGMLDVLWVGKFKLIVALNKMTSFYMSNRNKTYALHERRIFGG